MLKQVLQGMVVGIANIIPGVSGGTMMVAMGLYDRLIHAITHLKKEFKGRYETFKFPILSERELRLSHCQDCLSSCWRHIRFRRICVLRSDCRSLPFILKSEGTCGDSRKDHSFWHFWNCNLDGSDGRDKWECSRCKFQCN